MHGVRVLLDPLKLTILGNVGGASALRGGCLAPLARSRQAADMGIREMAIGRSELEAIFHRRSDSGGANSAATFHTYTVFESPQKTANLVFSIPD